jgi:hypothetical protein
VWGLCAPELVGHRSGQNGSQQEIAIEDAQSIKTGGVSVRQDCGINLVGKGAFLRIQRRPTEGASAWGAE